MGGDIVAVVRVAHFAPFRLSMQGREADVSTGLRRTFELRIKDQAV